MTTKKPGASAPVSVGRTTRERSAEVDGVEWLHAFLHAMFETYVAEPDPSDVHWKPETRFDAFLMRSSISLLNRVFERTEPDVLKALSLPTCIGDSPRLRHAISSGHDAATDCVGHGRMSFKRRLSNARKERLVAEALREGLSPLEAFKRAGIPRSTGYRIINRPNRKT
jgi:hypothetical protein